MANTSSAKKAVRQIKKRTEVNKARKNRIKTFAKQVKETAKKEGDSETRKAFVEYESEIMRGVTKGVYKKNTAARKLTKMASQVKRLKEEIKKIDKEVKKPVKKTEKKS